MEILGICAFDRLAGACLVRDGRILAAVREDVLSGRLGDRSFPSHAIAYCLRAGKIGPSALDLVSIAAPLEGRIPEGAYPEGGRAAPSFAKRLGEWLGRRPTLYDLLREELDPGIRAASFDATLAEASAAFLTSPFRESVVFVIGETGTTRWLGRDGAVEALGPAVPDDVATSAVRTRDETGVDALCVAGPGAQDRARNAWLRSVSGFARLWVGPAPGAEAAALGAAVLGWRRTQGAAGVTDSGESRSSTALGPAYNAAQIRTFLRSQGVSLDELGRDDAPEMAAALVTDGQRVGWLDGRLDVGEETAGSRSILRAPSPTAPPDPSAGEVLAVAAERVAEIFDAPLPCPSWLELPVAPRWRASLADARHPDRSLPVAPIAPEHRGFRTLLSAFERTTGLPAVVARPLRLPGRPIACAPADAWAVQAAGSIDALVMGAFVFPARPLTEGVGTREIGAFPPSPSRSP